MRYTTNVVCYSLGDTTINGIKSINTRYNGDSMIEALKEADYRGECLIENGFNIFHPSNKNQNNNVCYETHYNNQNDGTDLATVVYVIKSEF